MTDELRDRLSRLAEDAPTERPDVGSFVKRGKRRRRLRLTVSATVTIAMALALVVPLRGLSGLVDAKPGASSSPPASGYWVRFPDAPTVSGDGSSASLPLSTNLPEGTLYETLSRSSGSSDSSCCPSVKDGQIAVQAENSSCYGLVGDVGKETPMSVTITVSPTYDFISKGPTASSSPTTQPSSVKDVLGEHFENLTGDQVQPMPSGEGNELVASKSYAWPEPQCGGEPLPLFGGPVCQPAKEQLQGHTLSDAMVDVMGAITQARMCEFWGTDLTEVAAAAHPWDQFSAEWRLWFIDKDFTPFQNGDGTWSDSPADWRLVRRDGSASIIDITDQGAPILELRIEPLPTYCPGCSANTVPFWGITDWTFLQT